LDALVEALLAAAPALAGLVRERLQSEFDGDRALPPHDLEQTVRAQFLEQQRVLGHWKWMRRRQGDVVVGVVAAADDSTPRAWPRARRYA